MASEVLTQRPSANPGAMEVSNTPQQSRLTSTLEIEEPRDDEDNTVYPTGPKLWSTMASMAIACFLSGLDLTIVAVAVPSITDEFQTISDIGWYSAAYGMTLSAFVFFFGQIYTLFSIKAVFLIGIATFEVGSLICTLAPSSAVFILGRAVSGLGRGAINGGLFKLLRQCFPLSQQAITNSFFGSIQSVGLITAPSIGGALIDAFSWRACFGVNLPLGVMCLVLTAYGVHEQPPRNDAPVLTLKEKVKKVDFFVTLLAVPAITFLLMALQWGGTKFGWGTWQIIVPLVICALLFVAFGYLQYRQGDNALLPPRILKQRSIIAGMWYGACCEGVLAVTEYYMSIYFQGVRGYSPTKAGLLALPMVGGLAIAFIISGVGTTWIGYYYPFMLATSVLTPIASGLLTTLDLEEQIAKAVGLLTFLGLAVGLGLQGPQVALQAVLPIEDVSLGGAVITFGAGMGSALWICASATLFQDRLSKEIQDAAPGTNTTHIQEAGLSKLRESIGPERLKSVLSGYENAVVQTLYIPLALALLSIIGAVAMERKSIKKKRPIRAAPMKKGTTPLGPVTERAVAKRSAIIKSACLECRKRKAKCNGQKPVCVSCSKHDRECVYDSDIRELQVRGLQQANQKLQDELAAAKLLMRQMANGSAQLRGAVSELLEEEKQPSEISELLKSDGTTNLRTDEVDDSRLSSRLNDPILDEVDNDTSYSFPVDDFESFSADSSSMKQEQSSPDSDSCIAIGPVLEGDAELRDREHTIHPNYENNFGNLALSNSIRANGYPRHIQDAQIRNIFVPSWAATTLNTELDPGEMSNAFGDIYQKATSLLKKGEPTHRVFGEYPNIAALYDQDQFDRSCLLSQWAARMVHSVKCQGYDFTCFASMNVFWYMMRWMIDPSPETYAAMPEWIRPTTNQLFTPHISMADFVLWPAFRDLVVQFPQLQGRMAWLADMSMHIRCEWPYALEDALKPDPINGTVDLVDLAKLIRQWLTDDEAEKILSRFQNACIPNSQVLWSGMLREQAQQWTDAHGLQTLTTALGPLLYHGDPSPQTQARPRFIHGASIIFAWFISQGDLVIVLSHPPPLFFYPSGQTFNQLYEEPIIKGKMGNRPVGRIHTAHPAVEIATDFIYQLWPCDISWFWIKIFGIPDIEFRWRQTKTVKSSIQQPGEAIRSTLSLTSKRPETLGPVNKSVADTKSKITKVGQQKTKKKKVPSTVVDQVKNPPTKKSLKSGTSSNKQQLAKTTVMRKKQNPESGIKKKAKKKKTKNKKQKVAVVEKGQAQLKAKQDQKKPATMAKAKGSKMGAQARPTIKSVMKNVK
ncbi:major facilitator superfamily transporter [Fusarium coicis]|nr:major facilitator superfamily transporter [Fusarium coicis]